MSTHSPKQTLLQSALVAHVNAAITGSGNDAKLLNKAQLAERLNMTLRGVECMTRSRIIPVIKLGHRTLRYSWPRVCEALAKREVREV